MKDFTLDIYRELLERLQAKGYKLISYADYRHDKCQMTNDELRITNYELRMTNDELRITNDELRITNDKFVILRHDVDAKPENSLRTAQIEHSIGAKATYYFRVGKESNNPEIIRAIARLGHEIGYHYEDLSLCKGDKKSAWEHFQTWLDYFRQYYPVETICMHGAPTSEWDGKELWTDYDYKSLGIIGEPYLDTDFNDVFYLTDTGRCWDGYRVSLRDKIEGHQEEWNAQGLTWHTTPELIQAVEADRLPAHVMITSHPQRWTNNQAQWYKEYIAQTIKNGIKFCINRRRRVHSTAAH